MENIPTQGTIDLDRERLLRGRGAGAGAREVAAHTSQRREIAGIAVPVLLEATAEHAAAIRGDAAALAGRVARQRIEVARDLSVVAARARHGAGVTGRLTATFLVGVLVGALLRSRRGSRSTGGPPASRPVPARPLPRRRRTRPT